VQASGQAQGPSLLPLHTLRLAPHTSQPGHPTLLPTPWPLIRHSALWFLHRGNISEDNGYTFLIASRLATVIVATMRPALLLSVSLLLVVFGSPESNDLVAETQVNWQKPELGDADFPLPSPSPRHDQKVKEVRDGSYDVVLVGDSITQTLGELGGKYEPMKEVWNRHFAPLNAINLGHNGYRTEQILWNMQNGELDFKRAPKVVMLLIGTNNADDRNFKRVHTAEQIFAGTKVIVQTIRKRHPETRILILRIFPRGGDDEQGISPPSFNSSPTCIEICRRAGKLTSRLADGEKVFWLDVNHVFLQTDGSINTELMWDLLHPSPAGAELWVKAVMPTLRKLLKDELEPENQSREPETRPKSDK